MLWYYLKCIAYVFAFIALTCGLTEFGNDHHLFKLQKELIDDCLCKVETVDQFNNQKIYPRLKSLLVNDHFRYYKVNLKHECPFWTDDSRCAIRFCHVEACRDDEVPNGIKVSEYTSLNHWRYRSEEPSYNENSAETSDELNQLSNPDCNNELSYLNKTISADTYQELTLWQFYDSTQDNFCYEREDNGGSEYVDLLLNPERYTGYRGDSAHRIWHSIYMENCFRKQGITSYSDISKLSGMCFEKRVFYRVLSGLHTSINIHLCAQYLLSEKKQDLAFVSPDGCWGPNYDEFDRRFNPRTSNGEGPAWLRNLYFIYLVELRAIAKADKFLQSYNFFTSNTTNDEDVKDALRDLLNIIKSFPNHFNENSLFNGGSGVAMKEQFREQFKNISRIMDCVGCDKCKLWGKLQVHGLGTALKILFSGKFDDDPVSLHNNQFHLTRDEVVALMNAFGRLSTSIYQLEQFRSKYNLHKGKS